MRKRTLALITILRIQVVNSLAVCDQDVIAEAFNEGLLSFLVLNCFVEDANNYKTIQGTIPLDASACLSEFIRTQAGSGSHPLHQGSQCASQMQIFIENIINIRPSFAGFTYTLGRLQFQFDYTSWSSTLAPEIEAFSIATGASFGTKLCNGYQVRDMQQGYNAQIGLIKAGTGGPSYEWPPTVRVSPNGQDFCYTCYGQFVYYISAHSNTSLNNILFHSKRFLLITTFSLTNRNNLSSIDFQNDRLYNATSFLHL
jgi:hypothetical protein